jgi:hypothetical protein
MPEETAKPLTINQAFEKAKAEVSNPAAAEPTEKTVEKTEGDTKGQKQNNEPQPEQTEEAAGQVEETADTNDLLSLEDRSKLDVKGKEAYKKIMKAYTQKTQALAEERKRIEKYKDLIESYEEDPADTVMRLAKLHDIKVADNDTKPATATVVDNQVSKMTGELVALLGSENEQLAKGLAQIFEGNMRELAANVTKAEVEPIKRQSEEITNKTIADAAAADMKAFESRHKDWKQYEPKILEMASYIQPAPGSKISPDKYLDLLYVLATQEKSKAETTTEVVERLKNSVKNAEVPSHGVKEEIVTQTAPKNATIYQAMEAAKKGQRWAVR